MQIAVMPCACCSFTNASLSAFFVKHLVTALGYPCGVQQLFSAFLQPLTNVNTIKIPVNSFFMACLFCKQKYIKNSYGKVYRNYLARLQVINGVSAGL